MRIFIYPILALSCFLSFSLSLNAQYYNQSAEFKKANSVWTFGKHVGLNFNSGRPVGFTADSFSAFEGCASVADPLTSDLLFSFDGKVVRNKNFQTMPNSFNVSLESTVQAGVIVPVINNPNQYYLISLRGPSSYQKSTVMPPFNNTTGSLFYSVIDMNLDNGLGDILSSKKQIILDYDSLSESMIAVPGNNNDVWLIVHKFGKPVFKAYHITQTGIDSIPTISVTGHFKPTPLYRAPGFYTNVYPYFVGAMAISPDRSKLAIVSSAGGAILNSYRMSGVLSLGAVGVEVCNFDPCTGLVSNAIQLPRAVCGYGVAFSPDASKLYMIAGDTFNIFSYSSCLQFDVSTFDSSSIAASMEVIAMGLPINPSLDGLGYMRLYGDTIYINSKSSRRSLGAIIQPNLTGISCDLQVFDAIPLLDTHIVATTGMGALSCEIPIPLKKLSNVNTFKDTLLCGEHLDSPLSLKPRMLDSSYVYRWSDATTTAILSVFKAGTYWVEYNDGCWYYVDTFHVAVSDFVNPMILIDGFELSTATRYDTYQWCQNSHPIPGAQDSTYTVVENGDYTVIVSKNKVCFDTSDVYKVTNVGIYSSAVSPRIVSVFPNPAKEMIYINANGKVDVKLTTLDGRIVNKVVDAVDMPLSNLADGMYLLQICDKAGRIIKVEKIVKSY